MNAKTRAFIWGLLLIALAGTGCAVSVLDLVHEGITWSLRTGWNVTAPTAGAWLAYIGHSYVQSTLPDKNQ